MTRPAIAMILAAGRGERMRPLTDHCPKPLLKVRGKALMDWHVDALVRSGFTDLLINTAWLGTQITGHYENDLSLKTNEYGRNLLSISYSKEDLDFGHALETAGGIARALPQLETVFWLVAGDVFTPDFSFSQPALDRFTASDKLAHLWLVPNPPHHPRGDFGLNAEGLALDLPADSTEARYTYSTIGLYRRGLFAALPFGNPQGLSAPLAPLLRAAMARGQISAELYTGEWTDVGTPERLAALNQPFLS